MPKEFYNVCGWLSPIGSHFSCGCYGHRELADKICELQKIGILHDSELNDNPDYQEMLSCEYTLEKNGWCRISSFHEIQVESYKISPEQFEWCMKYLDFFIPSEMKKNLKLFVYENYIDKEMKKEIEKGLISDVEWASLYEEYHGYI